MQSKPLKGFVQRACIFQIDVKVKRGAIVDQQCAVAIIYKPARGIDALQPDAVIERQPAKFRTLYDLQVKQTQHQDDDRQRNSDHQPEETMAKPFTVDCF